MRHCGAAVAAAFGLLLSAAAAHAADPANGKAIYEANCAACHGADGNAVLPDVPHFDKGERLEKPDAELALTVRNGSKIMPAWNGVLQDSEIADAIAYIRTLAN